MARRREPHIPDAILDQLLSGTDAKTAFDQGGLLGALQKALPAQRNIFLMYGDTVSSVSSGPVAVAVVLKSAAT